MSVTELPLGDRLTVTFAALDGTREVSVTGHVLTIDEALDLIEDAMRGAGFHVPYQSLNVLKEDGDVR
jgi:hypothetical protein